MLGYRMDYISKMYDYDQTVAIESNNIFHQARYEMNKHRLRNSKRDKLSKNNYFVTKCFFYQIWNEHLTDNMKRKSAETL